MPDSDGSVRAHGSKVVASRHVVTFMGGGIFDGQVMVEYKPFALSIPLNSSVSKRVELSNGYDRLLKFSISQKKLEIYDVVDDVKFYVLMDEFQGSSSARVHQISSGLFTLFAEVMIYIRSDSGVLESN
jgi:hypothetical protein